MKNFFFLENIKVFFFFFYRCVNFFWRFSSLCFWCSSIRGVNVDAFVWAHLCALFGNSGTLHFISCQDGWRRTSRNERRGRIKQKERVDGQAGWEQKKKMCIRSHCASNVITGSDSSMWHAALPICQSEIGRVTNGYHCYFPQPPPPPPPHSNVCIFFRVLRETSDLNLGGSPRVGGPLWLWISADIRANLTC